MTKRLTENCLTGQKTWTDISQSIKMANKLRKRCLVLLLIKKMHIEITISYCHIHIRMLNRLTALNVGDGVKQPEHSYICIGCKII